MKAINLLLCFVFLIAASLVNAQSIYISELSYNPCTDQGSDTSCEYIIISNNETSTVDISDYTISNGFSYTFPVGATIPAGGSIALGISGNCTVATFDISGGWTGGLGNSGETLEILDASGTLVSSITYDNTFGDGDCEAVCFDASGTASACSSSVLDGLDCPGLGNAGDACLDTNGGDSTIDGTDCTCPIACITFGNACTDSDGDASIVDANCNCMEVGAASDLYISELSFDPCAAQGGDSSCEYIVITNGGTMDVDMSDYSIANGFSYTFPAGTTILAGGTISLGVSGNCTAGAFDLSGGWTGSMSNSTNETIEILDATGGLINSVTYDSSIGGGDCMASCFDSSGVVSACTSSVFTAPAFDCPAIMANIGDLCDDGDPTTNYDMILADCSCLGMDETFDCPGLQANVGDACDDGSPATENDAVSDDCICTGTPICIADFVVAEVTCDSIPGAPESYTVNIDFTNGGFDMFTITPNAGEISGLSCRCEGIIPPPPGDLVISELSFNPCPAQGNDGDCEYFILTNAGTNTIDLSGYEMSNAFTFIFPAGTSIAPGQDISVGISENCPNSVFDISGGWSGTMSNSNAEILFLSDSLGTLVGTYTYFTSIADGDCMAQCFDNSGEQPAPSSCMPSIIMEPDCMDLMLSIGDACDDMDASTGNDMVLTDCTCVGMAYDCPAENAFFGDACNDGNAATLMDEIQTDCTCAGVEPPPPGDIIITELTFNPCAEQGADGDCEYIVIQNDSAVNIDLTGWSIANAFDYTFPDGTIIIAGQSLSIGRSDNCNVATFDLAGGWDGSLGNSSNETILILDDAGVTISTYTYDSNIADDDCMAQCFDAMATPFSCVSSIFGEPVFDCPDQMQNVGDNCDDNNEMTVNDEVQVDCSCAGVVPTFECPDLMVDLGSICNDGVSSTVNDIVILGADNPDFDESGTIVITAIPEGTDLVFTITSANGCSFDINVPSPACEPVLLDCPASAKINEFHYDNTDTDANEFIEIVLPIGSDPTLVQVDLINGSTNESYDTYILTTSDFVSSDGTNDYYVWNPANLQNGPDGIALSCIDGSLYSFISYEGAITGIGAPVDGVASTDVGVDEDANNTVAQSIMCDGTGTFVANCTADPGFPNDLSTCIPDVPGCTDGAACNFNPNANMDDGSCIVATGCDECNGAGGVIDNPEAGDSCDDGDPLTIMDMIQADCTCAGIISPFDCPALEANVGESCDDANPATENDVVTDDCICAGTPICIADFVIAEVSCDSIPGAPESYTVNIDFTNGGFDMFNITPNAGEISGLDCRCEGIVPMPPGDLVISELSFNPCSTQGNDSDCEYFILTNTGNNTIDISGYEMSNAFTFTFPAGTSLVPGQDVSVGISENCPNAVFDITGGWSGSMGNSTAEFLFLSDSLGTLIANFTYDTNIADGDCMAQCFDNSGASPVASSCLPSVYAEPDCPDLMLSIGNSCDDMDDSTGNDVVQADCTCAGVAFECSNISAFVGDACDDDDITTVMDQVQSDCTCAGMSLGAPGEIIITELSFNPCPEQGDDGDCEYIIIQNNGATDIDLTGWSITNALDYIFPDGTIITAGQSLSIGSSTDCVVATFDLDDGWSGSLSNSNNETIIISDSTGTVISTYIYDANIADGDCMAQCFDASSNPSSCISSIFVDPVFECPDLMANVGGSCDDNNEMTVNDTVLDDCTCVGMLPTFECPDLMADLGSDCDDGYDTTVNDIIILGADNPDFDESGTIVITAIPEGIDLVFTITSANGCSFDINVPSPTCESVELDCPALGADVGDSCDDANPATENDVVTDDCLCAGTPTCIADFVVAEVSCDSIPGAPESYTVNIDFTNGGFDMFNITPNAGEISGLDCRCEGIVPLPPGDLVISELSFNPCAAQGNDSDCEYFILTNTGTNTIDISGYEISNAFTFTFPAGTSLAPGQDISVGISENCPNAVFDITGGWSGSMGNSTAEFLFLSDSLGTLVANFTYDTNIADGDCMAQCFDNSGASPVASSCLPSVYPEPDCPDLMLSIGNPCDDMDDSTGNDVVQADCTCAGVAYDCPDVNAFAGDSCDDNDITTVMDQVQSDCTCAGMPLDAPGDIIITELTFNPCPEQGDDGDCEYIIIQNTSTTDIDLTGWSITNALDYIFPDGTIITSGQSLSIGSSNECIVATFDLDDGWSGSLSNSNNETIIISDSTGTVISTYIYDANIADGDCMAQCFDASSNPSSCISSIFVDPVFDCPDLMANVGGSCDDNNEMTVNDTVLEDCTCAGVLPTFECPDLMVDLGSTCDDGYDTTVNDVIILGADNPDFDESGTIVITAIPEGTDLVFTITSANGCSFDINVPSPACEPVAVDCPTTAKVNEFHYDNADTDENEFIEIVLPAGADPTVVQVDLINGSTDESYDTYILATTDFVSSDGTDDYYVWNPGNLQNGPDGIALSCIDGTLYSFISYEGEITGIGAPVDGIVSTDIGVEEDSNNTGTQSIMCDGMGTFVANCTADPGFPNDLDTCVPDVPGCTDDTACNYDANANTDDGSCIVATGCDICDGMGGIIDNLEAGDSCDDGDPNTTMDMIQANCTCAGFISPFDCPILEADVDNSCDDANPATENDVVTDDCLCAGTPVCIADFVVADVVCDEIPGAPETYTVNIDFANGGFDMFNITPNAGEISGLACRCEGIVPLPPGDLVITELSFNPCAEQGNDSDCEYFILANTGTSTIDISGYEMSNAFTFTFPNGINLEPGEDITVGISENCPNTFFNIAGGWSGSMGNSTAEFLFLSDSLGTLVGTYTYDTNVADGDCMAQCFDAEGIASSCMPSIFVDPDCPELMLSIGNSCDDMDATTGNDVVQDDCTCAGVAYDCPDINAFIGDACDDDDITTVMDQIQADCTCGGMPLGAPGEIAITELTFNPCPEQGDDGDCEYIIIQNTSATDIDLTGWAIITAVDYSFPDSTIIASGQSLSIGSSDECAVASFDLDDGWSGSLSNSSNEMILILNEASDTISTYIYDANIADGDCMVQCFDASANPSSCQSSIFGDPVFDCPDLMANIGGSCDDNNEMTVNDTVLEDCTCAGMLPTFECPDLMVDLGEDCDDGFENTVNDVIILGADNPDFDESGTIVITAIPEGTDLVFTITSANGCSFDINVPSPACEPVPLDCPATAIVNEFHYDNADTDENEFVEIVLPSGSDPTLVQVDLINGSTSESYDTYILSTTDFVSSDGTDDYYVWIPSNLQNGPDGIALSCLDGTLYSFISYEEVITGVGAPVDGIESTDIMADEDANNTETQSIMNDGMGTFVINCTADPGFPNDLSTCVPDVLGCTDQEACNYNPDANVDDDSCILAEGCDDCDGMGGLIDNLEVGELCDDGDPETNYDSIQPDCSCAGTTETFDCPNLIANVGDSCDDDNPSTEQDMITDDCICAGTPVCIADFVVGDVFCETVTNGTDSYSVNISFTNGGSDMFTIEPNAGTIEGLDCRCQGIAPPPPGDLVISELSFDPCSDQGGDSSCEYFVISNNGTDQIDLSGYAINNAFTFTFPGGTNIGPGQSISVGITDNCPAASFDIAGGWSGSMANGNSETLDIIDAAGTLVGAFTYDSNSGDGNCLVNCFDSTGSPSECMSTVYDPIEFDCQDLMLNFEESCDDMDDTTDGDIVQADCTCAGTPFQCPELMLNYGDACDDMDAGTIEDEIQNDCSCAGIIPDPPGDIIITEISYNPCAEQGDDGDCEYIVIKNNSMMDYDLSGWALASAFSYTFPAGTIIAVGQSLSVGSSATCPVATFDLAGGWNGGMGNSGENILIIDNTGSIISSYTYNDDFGDGDCMAYCFDDLAVPSECESTVYGEPMYDCPELMAFIGESCDDNNEMTEMDAVTQDCVCVGVIPTFDCQDEMVNLGDVCDDGNEATNNDIIILGGDNPDFDNEGTIVVNSIPEGTDLIFTITSINGCSFDINVTAPLCEPEPTDCEPNSGNFPWNGQ